MKKSFGHFSFLAIVFACIAVLTSCQCEHQVVIDEAIAATCTETGLTEGSHCSVCNTVLVKQEEIATLAHTPVIDEAIAATCTETGLTEGSHCAVCNTVLVEQEIATLAHTPVIDEAIAATCTETGLTEGSHCAVCNTILVAQTETNALGHHEVIDAALDPTHFQTGLTEGKHCDRCQTVFVAQKVIDILPPLDITFPLGTITTEPITIETKHLEVKIPANVYVPDNFVENTNLITSIMEQVSGMSFAGNSHYSPDRLTVHVEKLSDTEREFGPAYAFPGGFWICSGDLVDLSTLIHEASHSLHYNQSNWAYCQWAMEGISTYTTYKTQCYIEKNHPELVETVNDIDQSLLDMTITDYNELYKHPLEYWMENTLEYSLNANYVIGFRFMWYLEEVYGNYTDWIFRYEKANPFYLSNAISNELAIDAQIQAFKMTYGEDVFDNFYPWLKENQSRFETGKYTVDLRNADRMQVYPMCNYSEISYAMNALPGNGLLYEDLFIDIHVGRHYLKEYKGKDTDDMALTVNGGVEVELYDAQGRLLRTEISKYAPIALEGVSFIKLAGSGKLTQFKISGFENYT